MDLVPQPQTMITDLIKKWVRRIERIALVAAVVCGGVFWHLYNLEKNTREAGQDTIASLPANVMSMYILKNRKLTILLRDAKGKVTEKVVYVPDEGKIEAVTKEKDKLQKKYDELTKKLLAAGTPEEIRALQKELNSVVTDINNATTVKITTWGRTSRFGYGLIAGPGISSTMRTSSGGTLKLPLAPMIDWKWFYYSRYSATLQLNPWFIGPGISRHIDDITPSVLHLDNLEWGASGGWGYNGRNYIGTFMRTNF